MRKLSLTMAAIVAAAPAFAYSGAEKAAFVKADANGNRQIERAEFKVLIDTLAASGAQKALSVKRWGIYGIAFAKIDANSDGVITPPELEAQR